MEPLHIHSKSAGTRFRYIIQHVFEKVVGWSIQIHTDTRSFNELQGPKLNYSDDSCPGSYQVMPAGILEEGVTEWDPEPISLEIGMVAFGTAADPGFDPFSFLFYLLSRMEEYQSEKKDEHGRFPSRDCWMVRNNTERIPIVEIVIRYLVDELRKRWSTLPLYEPRTVHVTTFDMDNGLKYAGREPWRAIGAFARDLFQGRLGEVRKRIGVHLFGAADPYELDELMQRSRSGSDRVITFFLVGDRGTHDHAVSIDGERMAKKVSAISSWSEIGLHPSYRTMENGSMVHDEMARLTDCIGNTVMISRQHFLRFRLPDTYRVLVKAGIKEEHSMGFHDRIGFRAGTCNPFNWYDLDGECETDLMIHPFTVMDSSLCYKMKLSIEEAIEQVMEIKGTVGSLGGTFTTIWHERFLAGTGAEQGWDRLFKEVVSNS